MNTCKTCKWWQRHLSEGGDDYVGDCSSPKFVENGRMNGVHFRDGLSVCDMEGFACFETGEDFGCVHWSAHE